MSATTKPIEIETFIEALKDSPDAQVHSIKDQLTNSIEKLAHTNSIFDDEINKIKVKLSQLDENESHDELRDDYLLYDESRIENSIVIKNQLQRVEVCIDELQVRGLIDRLAVVEEKEKLKQTVGVLDLEPGLFGKGSSQNGNGNHDGLNGLNGNGNSEEGIYL